jgi:hypothetical protein
MMILAYFFIFIILLWLLISSLKWNRVLTIIILTIPFAYIYMSGAKFPALITVLLVYMIIPLIGTIENNSTRLLKIIPAIPLAVIIYMCKPENKELAVLSDKLIPTETAHIILISAVTILITCLAILYASKKENRGDGQ